MKHTVTVTMDPLEWKRLQEVCRAMREENEDAPESVDEMATMLLGTVAACSPRPHLREAPAVATILGPLPKIELPGVVQVSAFYRQHDSEAECNGWIGQAQWHDGNWFQHWNSGPCSSREVAIAAALESPPAAEARAEGKQVLVDPGYPDRTEFRRLQTADLLHLLRRQYIHADSDARRAEIARTVAVVTEPWSWHGELIDADDWDLPCNCWECRDALLQAAETEGGAA